jgi:hypothetical protein
MELVIFRRLSLLHLGKSASFRRSVYNSKFFVCLQIVSTKNFAVYFMNLVKNFVASLRFAEGLFGLNKSKNVWLPIFFSPQMFTCDLRT